MKFSLKLVKNDGSLRLYDGDSFLKDYSFSYGWTSIAIKKEGLFFAEIHLLDRAIETADFGGFDIVRSNKSVYKMEVVSRLRKECCYEVDLLPDGGFMNFFRYSHFRVDKKGGGGSIVVKYHPWKFWLPMQVFACVENGDALDLAVIFLAFIWIIDEYSNHGEMF
ncbi:hypothetical protein GL2_04370 [Microbulbifer sp. GL-2]|nr:hypothetical protein GL2_04370 [Microbulbifer sp. GL-2]